MSLFKCKMCGGSLEISKGITVAECEYCGTKQTVPKAMDENLQNLFSAYVAILKMYVLNDIIKKNTKIRTLYGKYIHITKCLNAFENERGILPHSLKSYRTVFRRSRKNDIVHHAKIV